MQMAYRYMKRCSIKTTLRCHLTPVVESNACPTCVSPSSGTSPRLPSREPLHPHYQHGGPGRLPQLSVCVAHGPGPAVQHIPLPWPQQVGQEWTCDPSQTQRANQGTFVGTTIREEEPYFWEDFGPGVTEAPHTQRGDPRMKQRQRKARAKRWKDTDVRRLCVSTWIQLCLKSVKP